MASFAQLNNSNVVISVHSINNEVIKDENGVEQENLGIIFLKKLWGEDTVWKQTSYNTHGGVHKKNGVSFRKNHASKNFTYNSNIDAFIPPKPYNSWILNEDTCLWSAPVIMPIVEWPQIAVWNENLINWEIKTAPFE